MLALALITAFSPTSKVRADESTVGFVLEVSGNWVVVGDKKNVAISGGDQLPAGAVVRPAKPGKNSFLVVCLFDGKTKRYEKEEKLPTREKEGVVNRVWSAVMGRYRGSVVQAASRGNELLTDGVALLKDEKVDLAPFLEELPDGNWSFRIRKHTEGEKSESPADSKMWNVSVRWTSGEPAAVEVGDLKEGLYELQIINPRTKRVTGTYALVLVCNAETYEKDLASYKEAVELTESWNDETRDASALPFLRAYLKELASAGEQ